MSTDITAGDERLMGYVETWWSAIDDFAALLEQLLEEDWSRPTDLPGWDVRAVASHTAHLEGLLGGAPREEADVPEADHIRGMMGQFTEIGVITRRDTPPAEIIDQIRRYAAARHDALLAAPPEDGAAPAPGVFGAIGWDTERLLRNRPLDVWMHEQDVRRAVGRPGNLDSQAAVHTVGYLLESLGLVLAKRAGAPAGTTLVAYVEGHPPAAYAVGDDGRGRVLPEPPASPTTVLRMDRETFVRLAGGRGEVPAEAVSVEGDQELGRALIGAMAVTP